jgi:ribulose-5-phosphate 4-epimerase/fuculose-1-phosphate aldolase
MNTVTSLRKSESISADEWQLRVDLAAAFRLAARCNWHEAVANHFSLAVSGDGAKFLMNPKWRHFSRIRANDLLILDANDQATMSRPDAPDPSAWCIHGTIHAKVPQARCLLHVHPAYGTAVAALADPEIKPIDQNTARFFNRIVYDDHFGGIADTAEEGERLAGLLGERRIMMMGNHGVLVAADSVAQAFDDLYYLERACQTLILAYSTGKPLNIMSDNLAEHTARGWEAYAGSAVVHFEEMKRILDDEDPGYAD